MSPKIKRSKVEVQSYKNIAGVGLCTYVSARFF